MRPDAEPFFQFNRVMQQRHHLETPVVQPEQDANSHIVNSGFIGSVHAVQPPLVIALNRILRMQLAIGFVMIRFLKNLIRAESGVFQTPQVFDGKRRGVHVSAANRTNPALDLDFNAVNRFQRLHHVVNIGVGVLAEDDNQAFMADFPGQDFDFFADFVLRQHPARHVVVMAAKAAISAVIDADRAEVERRERDDAVVINVALDFSARDFHFAPEFRVLDMQQHGGFRRVEPRDGFCFFDNLAHTRRIRRAMRRERLLDFDVIDEVFAIEQIFFELFAFDALLQPILRVHGGSP